MPFDNSHLDLPQILQNVYDDSTQTLRTTATAVIVGGSLEVEISEENDSILVYGNDGTNNQVIKTDTNGELQVDVLSSALPNGAATAAKQDTGNASLASIDSKLTSPITVDVDNFPATQNVNVINSSIAVTGPLTDSELRATPVPISGTIIVNGPTNVTQGTTPWIVDGSGVTQPISASSLPLPTGASTSANQVTANTSLASIDSKLTSPITITATDLDIRDLIFATDKVDVSGSSVSVSNFPAVQPVSGTITANQGTSPWVISGTITTSPNVNIHDGSGNSLTSQVNGSQQALDVGINVSGVQVDPRNIRTLTSSDIVTTNAGSGTFQTNVTNASGASAVNIQDGGNSITVDGTVNAAQSGTWNINNVSGTISLPTGASTSALQTTGNTSLSSIDTKLTTTNSSLASIDAGIPTALGQTTMANSMPVVIASDQSAVPVSQSGSWSVTANAGTNLNTSLLALESGGNLASIKTNTDNLNLSQASTTSGQKGNLILGATTTAAPSYTTAQSNPLSLTISGALRTDSSATTQPISGTVTANAGTGNFTVVQPTGTNLHTVIDSGSITVNNASGASAVNIQDGGNSITVDGSVTVSGTVAATQSGTWTVQPGNTANTTPWLSTINQGGNSATVTASNALKVDGSAVTQPISGTVIANAGTNLNTSALALDTSVNGILVSQGSTTSGEKGPLIQGAVTTSSPSYSTAQTSPLSLTTSGALRTDSSATTQPISGTITANQGGTWNINNISGTVSLPTGASTSANQTTANTSLASIDGKLNSLGQKTMSASMPVTIASDQSTIPVAIQLTTATYSASTSGSAITTTTPQDVFTITGSGTKTIKILRIGFSVTQTTASTNSISLIKRAANTGGTSTTITAVPHDSNNAGATATVHQYTANPTPGAAVGFMWAIRAFIGTVTSVYNNRYEWDFSTQNEGQLPTLRGTNETLAINFGGTTIAGANPSFYVVWTEE